ncbi:MAG: hypothetical protein ABI351_07930, partial [Herbaspirillum sp.]
MQQIRAIAIAAQNSSIFTGMRGASSVGSAEKGEGSGKSFIAMVFFNSHELLQSQPDRFNDNSVPALLTRLNAIKSAPGKQKRPVFNGAPQTRYTSELLSRSNIGFSLLDQIHTNRFGPFRI